MADDRRDARITRPKGGRAWRIAGSADVEWIANGTTPGLAITSAIPPVFEAYATANVPGETSDRDAHDRAIVKLLVEQSGTQPWWLGYLDTGADDIVFPDAPMVTLYSGWRYVVVEAGPAQAANWKDRSSWRGALPDLIFPADHAWLLSTLWDDDWRCLGGPAALVERFARDPIVQARRVGLEGDATPPGHSAR